MNFTQILNSLLSNAQNTAHSTANSSQTNANSSLIKTLGSSAVTASVVSMLLNGKKGKSSLNKLGSMAALGSIAYMAYQNWQKNQSTQTATALSSSAFDHSKQSEQDASRIILRTMIAAAAIDGEIDAAEYQLLAQENQEQQWLQKELQNPASITQLAQEVAGNTALAAEAYLAARCVCAQLNRKEIVFLSQLAQAFSLDESLVQHLEKQAGF